LPRKKWRILGIGLGFFFYDVLETEKGSRCSSIKANVCKLHIYKTKYRKIIYHLKEKSSTPPKKGQVVAPEELFFIYHDMQGKKTNTFKFFPLKNRVAKG